MNKKLVFPKPFKKRLKKLPPHIQDKFWVSLETLLGDPSYPSLRHGRIESTRNWEFSITMSYRVTYRLEGNKLIFLNIGKHDEVFRSS